jgi:glycosyltransferase involved in cell wall biosynthesis
MACGIPCVVSPVGVNTEIVDPGVNGLTATGEDEWKQALRLLIGDAQTRRRLGQAARETVVDRYSAARWAPELARVLRQVGDQSGALGPDGHRAR